MLQRRSERILRHFAALVTMATLLLSPQWTARCQAERMAKMSVRPAPLRQIEPGTVVQQQGSRNWSHLVLLSTSRLAAGDVKSTPAAAATYTKMFNLVLMANIGKDDGGNHFLDRVGIGFATPINGKRVIVTSTTAGQLGANLGFIGKRVLAGNEACLDDVVQVARFATMTVFDAKAVVQYQGEHTDMVMRHVVWVSPSTGKLGTLVWLLKHDGDRYALAEKTMQLLPQGFVEDRQVHVDASKFVLGVPTEESFALLRIPQGRAIEFGGEFARVAATKSFDERSLVQFVRELQQNLAQASNR